MAGGKTILIFFVCLNIVSLIVSYGLASQGAESTVPRKNFVLALFFDIDENTDLAQSGGPNLNQEYEDQINEVVTPQSAGFSIAEGFSVLLDGLKMILGLLALLTPIPMIAFVYSFAMPIMISLAFLGPAFILYSVALMEFTKGGEF